VGAETGVAMSEVQELWREYARTRDSKLRERLIESHLPLVRYIATKMLPSLHASVQHQDLVSYGVFGLMDAVDRYDVEAGTKFSTFATYRIQGSINDEMRAQAWEPRNVRSRYRQVLRAVGDLERELGRIPSEIEVATHVGISVEELRRIEGDARVSQVGSLSAPFGGATGESDSIEVGDTVEAPALGDLGYEVTEAARSIGAAIQRLDEQDRSLFEWIYVHGLTFRQIADMLSVTESWISHLHTGLLVRLQRTLSALY
jgi:RNA polymerase sigma factor for flagellar operon FliA